MSDLNKVSGVKSLTDSQILQLVDSQTESTFSKATDDLSVECDDFNSVAQTSSPSGSTASRPKRPLKQATLRLSAVPSANQLSLTTNRHVVVETSCRPLWLEQLLPYFELVSISASGAGDEKNRFELKCLLCDKGGTATKSITDKGSYSFTRHLKRFHPTNYTIFEENKNGFDTNKKSKNVGPEASRVTLSDVFTTVVVPYEKNDPRQKRFEEKLLNYIITDIPPFLAAKGEGFLELMTLKRRVEEKALKITKKIQGTLQEAPAKSLHFIIDIWSTPKTESIMGIKVQWIRDWRIVQVLVGFKHFPESHTKENIRKLLIDVFQDELQVTPNQVGSVTSDNAANMVAAFRLMTASEILHPTFEVLQDADDDQTDLAEINPEEFDELDERNEDTTANNPATDMFADSNAAREVHTTLKNWTGASVYHNGCLAHLLQLAIRDAVNSTPKVQEISRKINNVTSFFSNSSKWMAVFRKASNGLCLVRPVITRWNSLFLSIQRLLKKTGEINIVDAVNTTLTAAKGGATSRSSIPDLFFTDEIEFMQNLCHILEPFATLTNEFQAEGVTSSTVILGLINAIKGCESLRFENCTNQHELELFRDRVCGFVVARFSTSTEKTAEACKRRIMTLDVLRKKNIVLASILDPRIKMICFDASLVQGSMLNGKIETEDNAIKLLQELYIIESRNQNQLSCHTEPPLSTLPEEPPKKKMKGAMALLTSLQENARKNVQSLAEIDEYLKDPLLPSNKSPLLYWKSNEARFPILSSLARQYLGMSASSGSLERLFSVAAALGKARSARLLPHTTECILKCKFFVASGI